MSGLSEPNGLPLCLLIFCRAFGVHSAQLGDNILKYSQAFAKGVFANHERRTYFDGAATHAYGRKE
jgi:hypothetical protein